jgi:hypothetical protein
VFIGGVQILCLGVIGEYLGKIYIETKGRPRYFIEHITSSIRAKRVPPSPQVVEGLRRGGRLEDAG